MTKKSDEKSTPPKEFNKVVATIRKAGKPSPHSKYKEICQGQFIAGYTILAVQTFFNEIPRRTLENWYNELKDQGRIVEFDKDSAEDLPEDVAYIFKNKNPEEGIPDINHDDDLPDILWAKRACKRVYRTAEVDTIRLKAVDVFLKAVAIQASKPELAELTKASSQDLEIDYSKLSEEELAQLYKEKLG